MQRPSAEQKDIIEDVILLEGGYSKDPSDRGGETIFGISRRHNTNWEGWALVDTLRTASDFPKNAENDAGLRTRAITWYVNRYWHPMKLDEFNDADTRYEFFEMAVNLGAVPASKIIQRTVNVLNNGGKRYKDVEVDGIIGAKTIEAIKGSYLINGIDLTLKVVNILQGTHYIELMEDDESQEKFARGWLKRVRISK